MTVAFRSAFSVRVKALDLEQDAEIEDDDE